MTTRDPRMVPWPQPPQAPPPRDLQPEGEPRNADGSTNYGYLDRGRWWENPDVNGIGRGWVRDERFGSGQVIRGTNRAKQRKAKTC